MGVPIVTTLPATNITSTNFTPNGNITDTGDSDVTERGFYYIKGANRYPVFPGSHQMAYENATAFPAEEYSLELFDSPLLPVPATTYSVVAYATNSSGTGYGYVVNVTTSSDVPTVLTSSITSRTDVSFLGNGNITNLSGRSVTKRGFCYIPLVSNNFIDTCDNLDYFNDDFPDDRPIILNDPSGQFKFYYNGDGNWPFGGSITLKEEFIPTGFTDSLTIILRSKFDTSLEAGISSGHETVFSLNVSSSPNWYFYVLIHSDGLYIEYDDWNGYYNRIGRGSVISGSGAIFQNWKFILNFNDGTVNVLLMNDGDFVYTSLGVVPFAFNKIGNPNWVALESLSNPGHPATPQVVHVDLIEFDGCYNIPTISDSTSSESSTGFSLGPYSLSIPELTPSTFYAIRSYATNSMGTGYGYTLTSETAATGELPGDISVQTDPATSITNTSFTGNGEIINTAGYNATNVGIVYLIHEGVPTVPTLFFYPCTDLSGWTINAPTTGTVIVDGYDGFKLDSGASIGSDIEIYRTDVGWEANRILTVRVKTYFDTNEGASELYIHFDSTSYGSIQIIFNISDNFISVGSNIIPGTGVLKSGVSAVDQTWEFRINATDDMAVTCEVYLDNVFLVSYDSDVEDRILSNQNNIYWTTHGLTNTNVIHHLKEISCQLGLGMSSITHYNVDLGVEPFSFPITNLILNTDYIVRAYGINQEAIAYGNPITVTTSNDIVDRYWVGGTGSTNDTDHWSLTSGGTGGADVPTADDNVYFDGSSFTGTGQTVTVGISFTVKSINFSNVLYTPTFDISSIEMYANGDITFVPSMVLTIDVDSRITVSSGTCNLTSAGLTLPQVSVGVELSLSDDLTVLRLLAYSVGAVFNSNGHTVNICQFSGEYSTFNFDGSTVNFTEVLSQSIYFEGIGGLTISGIGTTFNIPSGCTFRMDESDDEEQNTISGSSGSKCVFAFDLSSTVVSPITNTTFTNVTVTGPELTALLSDNNVDGGGNTGIIFSEPVGNNKYWVGNSGDWDDTSHWSLTSGGASGAHIPTQYDNVHFDINSFSIDNPVITGYLSEFNSGIITSDSTGSLIINISGFLVCYSDLTIDKIGSEIRGILGLIPNTVLYGPGIIEFIWCFSGVRIFGDNIINTLILDTNSDPTATFKFEFGSNQTIENLIVNNSSSSSQASIHCLEPPPVIIFNGANPGVYGDPVTLTWNIEYSTSCSIDQGIGPVASTGSLVVYPTERTLYTFSATGEGGTSESSLDIYAVPIVNFTADPIDILSGDPSTLTWTTSNADYCIIDQEIGTVSANGSLIVYPTHPTIYSITAFGDGGTYTESVEIYIIPSVEITADPEELISYGDPSTLTWDSTNATSCFIDQGIGIVSTSGSLIVNPLIPTTYTITASGPGGTNSANVRILAGASVEISADPEILTLYGDPSTLTWSSTNASSCSINQGIGEVLTSGSLIVNPSELTEYIITATGEGGDSTASIIVYAIPTVNISSNPSTIISYGDPSTLTWSSTNAISCSIDQGIGDVALNDSLVVTPLSRTIYTITATGDSGIVTSSAKVIEVLKEYNSYVNTSEPL